MNKELLSPVSWDEVEVMVGNLADKIVLSGFLPTMIAPIPRGGWVVATLLAQLLDIKKAVAIAQDKSGSKRNTYLSSEQKLKGERILVIEDSIETGKSLFEASACVSELGAETRTVAILVSPTSTLKPDFFLETKPIPNFPWDIGQPIQSK